MSVGVIVPTLDRHKLLSPLAGNIHDTVPRGCYTLFFVVDEDDEESQRRVSRLGNASLIVHNGTYPAKTNVGVHESEEEFVALVNDDVLFHPGWYEAAMRAFRKPSVNVVGGPDLSPATENRDHATMPIVRRSYIEDPGAAWNEPGIALHEGYHHNYSETELWQLALDRGCARFVNRCVIEHRHPDWGKGESDETYRRGAWNNFESDQALFLKRAEAWRRR